MSLLDDALDAVEDGGDALVPLLAAWRKLPAPEIARLVLAAGRLAGEGVEPVPARRVPFEERAATRDPAELPALLDAALAPSSSESLRRLRKISALGPDPRITERLVGWLLDPPFTAHSTRSFWAGLGALLREQTDPSALPRLVPAMTARSGAWRIPAFRRPLDMMASALRAIPDTRLAKDDAGLAARIGKALDARLRAAGLAMAAAAASAEELLRAIRADPADDGARLVYADWLLERGDPRGELIQLQMTGRDPKREKYLLGRNRAAWLEGLPIDGKSARFRRGFLASARMVPLLEAPAKRGVDRPPPIGYHRSIGNPAWATFEELDVSLFQMEDEELLAKLLTDPVMRALERVTGAPAALVPLLVAEGWIDDDSELRPCLRPPPRSERRTAGTVR